MPPPWRASSRNTDLSWGSCNERAIVHLNVADFAVAVERVIDSRLKTRPVVVAVPGQNRSAVYDMSEEAFQSGVRKGMAVQRALRLCSQATVIAPRFDRYERAMNAFLLHAQPYSPLIEAEEVNGHVFMDLSGTGRLFGPPPDIAWRIRKETRGHLGFDPIWTLAPNKFVAKVASRLVKPTGEYIVQDGEQEEFLKPLPIHLLPGLEQEDLLLLKDFNISRTGQLSLWTPDQWRVVFGRRGDCLHQMVRGEDLTPVQPYGQKEEKVQADFPFGDDTNDWEQVESVLFRLVEKIGFELRRRQRVARRLTLGIDYSDGIRTLRQKADPQGSANDFKLFAWAGAILKLAWSRRTRIRCLKLCGDRLAFPSAQLSLFAEIEQENKRRNNLMSAIDQIRRRFGKDILQVGLRRYHAPAA
jgi:DNA polymerase IV